MSDEERGDNVRDATLPVLFKIQETLTKMGADIAGMRGEIGALRAET